VTHMSSLNLTAASTDVMSRRCITSSRPGPVFVRVGRRAVHALKFTEEGGARAQVH
jgi:hypothetical protein